MAFGRGGAHGRHLAIVEVLLAANELSPQHRAASRPTGVSNLARRFLAFFVPSALTATAVCALLYGAVQQDLRQGANDPQYQLAEDAVARLDAGAQPSAVVGGGAIDAGTSLAAFVAVYDVDGNPLATNGSLDGAAPAPPRGVLDAARHTGADAVTWQPRSGVRVAIVVLRWEGGTVLAGRSLRRVEELESAIETLVALGWLALLSMLVVAAFVSARLWPASRRARSI